jgi:very-short-patch-repair endonuclease
MTTERKTLGVSLDAAPKADPKAGFAATGARLDKLKERARLQRRAPTPAQAALWDKIGESKLGGIKFTRQAIVGSTLVDFACPSRWLVVVLSPEGLAAEVEVLQDKKLTDVGVRVLRYAESAVLDDADSVAKSISVEVNKPFIKPGAKSGTRREAPRRDAASRSSYGARPPRRDAGGGRGGYQR